jgi:Na+/H+ antiporter NhaD/arsenite permease-like protein
MAVHVQARGNATVGAANGTRWGPRRRPAVWIGLGLGMGALLVLLAALPGLIDPARLRASMLTVERRAPAIAAGVIFAATYAVVAVGRMPGVPLDRAEAALVGASLMVASGVLTLDDAYQAIDFNTITLLLGMMIVVAHLRLSGVFQCATGWIVTRARHPLTLLAGVTLVSGLCSAFLVNDAICLALTPLVLDLTRRLRRNPLPYLLAVAMASNVGSAATLTGNPQNMMIGSLSHIPYGVFAAALMPIAAVGLVLTAGVIALRYRAAFGTRTALHAEPARPYGDRPFGITVVLVTGGMVVACFLGVPPATAAIVAGALLLLTGRIPADQVYREIDGRLLVMFAGLFVVVAGFENTVLSPSLIAAVSRLPLDNVAILSGVTALLSNLVSNVPAVLVCKPFIASLPDPQRAWLTVAMASTLAGNATLLGSVANLIVVHGAEAEHVKIDFWTYCAIGAPLALLTIAVGVLWLVWA